MSGWVLLRLAGPGAAAVAAVVAAEVAGVSPGWRPARAAPTRRGKAATQRILGGIRKCARRSRRWRRRRRKARFVEVSVAGLPRGVL